MPKKLITLSCYDLHAYSLIELIISMAIMCFLLSISIPYYTNLLTTLEAHQSLNQLQAILNFAKHTAQTHQSPIQVNFKPTQNLSLTDLKLFNIPKKSHAPILIFQDPNLFQLKYGTIIYNHPNLRFTPLTFYPAGHVNLPGTFSYHAHTKHYAKNQSLILSRTGQSRRKK